MRLFLIRKIKKIYNYFIKGFIEYKIIRHLKPLKPTIFHFSVTSKCNGRCVMCNIWKQKGSELSLKEIEKLLNDPIFNDIKYCALGGGEPTLREDLTEVVKIIISKCKNLESIGFSTNGLLPERVTKQVSKITDLCNDFNISFAITVSLDGLGETHNRVRGISNAFERTLKTIEALVQLKKKKNFSFGINCVITKWNAEELLKFFYWLKHKKLESDFAIARPQRRLMNEDLDFLITDSQRIKVKNFVEFLKKEYPLNYSFQILLDELKDQKRKLICPFVTEAISVESDGNVYFCPNSKPIGNIFQKDISSIYYDRKNLAYRKLIEKKICPTCHQDCFWNLSFYKCLEVSIPFILFNFPKYLKAKLKSKFEKYYENKT